MATSGSKSVTVTSYDTLKFSWERTSYSVEDNTSTVSWKMQLISTDYGKISSTASKDWSVTVNGTKYSGTNTVGISNNSTKTLASGKTVITHDSDGSKTFDYSFSQEFSITFSGSSIGTKSGSSSGALPDIPRAATITSAPNFNDEANPTIKYSNSAGNAVTSLKACIASTDGKTIYVPYRDISKTGTSYTFNLTEAERNALRGAVTSGYTAQIKFYVQTDIGGTTYRNNTTKTLTLINYAPTLNPTAVEDEDPSTDGGDAAYTMELTGSNAIWIKGRSDIRYAFNATALKGASISSYRVVCGSKSGTSASGALYNVDGGTVTFTVTDSRGNSASETVTGALVNYIKPTCYIASNRPDALGNMTVACSGQYFNDTFGAVENTLTVQYRYTILGTEYSDDWTDMRVTITNNSYYASANFVIPDFNHNLFYSFETRAIDKLQTVTSSESSVKSIPIFHWGENDFVFEVPVTFNAGASGANGISPIGDDGSDQTINGNLNVTGDLRLKGSGNYGNYLRFGDSNYCYLAELSDDALTIHASKLYLDANSGVYVDGYAIPILDKGIWTPSLSSSAISSYTTQYGWYSKIGQSVTIGFYIKATCKSGYDSTSISISGVPFTPLYVASGGGMCSGAYVAANQNFQCYVVETNKTITTRTQACNNTASTNLTTSASGCWYRSGGGEITLSGTITFIANS